MSKKSSIIVEPEISIEEVKISNDGKVGIIGGTFNPPHMGHLVIAEQVKDQLDLDRILFMPTAEPPHSSVEKKTIDPKVRVEMLDLAIQDNLDFSLELYEINSGGKNYTYDTMKSLKDLYPNVEFYFIVGGDMIDDLPTWHRIDELVEFVQLVGVERPGFKSETDYPIIMVDIPMTTISSSLIRDKVSKGCSIKYLVPKNVEKYIELEG
ncbi:MAG: nicotinate-nucleotide adenylyltransferase, partial [Atopostipes sp.]|nr:nicotinate-nucleotide adenylyltransferase [Atopostipes sp.]